MSSRYVVSGVRNMNERTRVISGTSIIGTHEETRMVECADADAECWTVFRLGEHEGDAEPISDHPTRAGAEDAVRALVGC